MRTIIPLNDHWLFAAEVLDEQAPDSAFETVTLPHTNVVLPHHNFDNREYQFISTYRKRFRLPEPRNGRRVFVDFEGVMIAATVFVNGQNVGTHGGGYVPFSFDITDALHDGENLLTVQVDSTERPDIPPYGYVVDYLTFGGLYREVSLRLVAQCYIRDVFVRPIDVLKEPRLEIDITIRNEASMPIQALVSAVLDTAADARSTAEFYMGVIGESVHVEANSEQVVTLHYNALPMMDLWTLEKPVTHAIDITMQEENTGMLADGYKARFGLREAEFRKDGSFYLNGEPLKLRGLNRHQTYPYIGAAAPKRLQRKDADILKYELGCNIVRTSHYPQSVHFIDRCDEIGLLVFEEIPGWQHIGDDDWKALSLRDVESMIVRDRNHPSIVLWGVRINESADDDALYSATNALAHRLDPTRQTGGVRNFVGSNLLEDVYTYNDFSNTIIEPEHTPHLVTEFNGHMFPTKTWDGEDRAMEHALRHARVQSSAAANPRVSGAIGWCAFDYNTHAEFGSGDRICYHGVTDIFRLPKLAAYFYESQLDPAIRPVVRVCGYWTMGDRSEGGNDPLYVFSNCEEIAVYVGGVLHGHFKPDSVSFPGLPHPPFKVTDLGMLMTWGSMFRDLRVVGLIGGLAVAETSYSAEGLPRALVLEPDDTVLEADGSDMTRLVVRITDQYGNRLPYAHQSVQLTLEGPGELVGENPLVLMGGQAAVYVRSGHQNGQITIRASTQRLADASAAIVVQ